MSDLELEMTVNGRAVKRRGASRIQRLLDFLRDDLNLTGTKEGCGAGECGTCSVFVDGKLVKSCLMPVAKAQGSQDRDHRGPCRRRPALTEMQRAFHKTGASQCGYCIPGMVMAATSALRENPDAGIEEIKERLGGNICRCTGYTKIFEAVEIARDVISRQALARRRWRRTPAGNSFIGNNVRRLDAPSQGQRAACAMPATW